MKKLTNIYDAKNLKENLDRVKDEIIDCFDV